ncbi:hypothetical protein GCM10017750_55100 [Streptomyces racemochromogenes]
MLHCPYASQSVSWAQSFAAGASMRDSAVTSAMRPPLLVGYVRRKVAPAGGTYKTDDLSDTGFPGRMISGVSQQVSRG